MQISQEALENLSKIKDKVSVYHDQTDPRIKAINRATFALDAWNHESCIGRSRPISTVKDIILDLLVSIVKDGNKSIPDELNYWVSEYHAACVKLKLYLSDK